MPFLTKTTISASENASYGRVSGLVFYFTARGLVPPTVGISLLQQCPSHLCDYEQDELDHTRHCNNDNGIRAGRHDRLRDCIHDEAERASLNPTKELPGLAPGLLPRPADWTDGRKVVFDVSVTPRGVLTS